MPYDFDKPVDRRNTHSLKWDVKEHELPMWVADMDFQTAPEIQTAIQERAAHGVFGYSIVPEDERVIIRTKLEKPSKIKGLALI